MSKTYKCEIKVEGRNKSEVLKHLMTVQKQILDGLWKSDTRNISFQMER